jgi:putative oxidoreductase
MKVAYIIVRILMGLMFLFASLAFFFKLMPMPELSGPVKTFMEGMQASIYLLPFVKVVELLCGLAFISGFFVPLAAVVIFPITLNILFYSAFLDPKGLPIGVLLLLGNLFLAFYHRKKYAPMLVP